MSERRTRNVEVRERSQIPNRGGERVREERDDLEEEEKARELHRVRRQQVEKTRESRRGRDRREGK